MLAVIPSAVKEIRKPMLVTQGAGMLVMLPIILGQKSASLRVFVFEFLNQGPNPEKRTEILSDRSCTHVRYGTSG